MIILAHRGNIQGPDHAHENSIQSIGTALSLGFSVETDLRYSHLGDFYISHDPKVPYPNSLLKEHAKLWRSNPEALIALNIKELGTEILLANTLADLGVQSQTMLFDMELIEQIPGETARLYYETNPSLTLAARVSDHAEPIDRALRISEATAIWLDEFDDQWVSADAVSVLKAAGKKIFAVSPDLHQFSLEVAMRRWHDFAQWGVDGICTDWPIKLREVLGTE